MCSSCIYSIIISKIIFNFLRRLLFMYKFLPGSSIPNPAHSATPGTDPYHFCTSYKIVPYMVIIFPKFVKFSFCVPLPHLYSNQGKI